MIAQAYVPINDSLSLPIYRLNTIVIGAGAAGMNCAVHLYEFMRGRGIDAPENRVAIVTAGVGLGASRMSGSDKQTYYKLGTSPTVADSAVDFAKTLTAFGCAHGDVALAEGESSLREFFHLVQSGVPFPHDPEGAYIGYKTDHDPSERATSAGPKTSRFMAECLQAQSDRYGIRIFDGHEVAHLLTRGDGSDKRIVGVVTLDRSRIEDPVFGLTVFLCENLVLAAGGPGELYEVSVYPPRQTGLHGLALAAGLSIHNLTESQFGLASTRFRWNVSGTYMQVVPRIFSTDRDGGDPREFLTPFFSSTAKMATNIFLKGYQWPFDPQRIVNEQSSLIDMAVHHESRVLGRRVFLDFTRNPIPGRGMPAFRLDDLESEALTYLQRNGALQPTPIDRLEHMNPLAIDIYAEHGIDIRKEPLEIAVCAQHHNGGFVVDKWWRSSVSQTFVIGEMAGTHGVKRPGGSALNAGQVGGLRAAEYIANVCGGDIAPESMLGDEQIKQIEGLFLRLRALQSAGGQTPAESIREIQHRMSEHSAYIRDAAAVESAAKEARAQYKDIRSGSLRVSSCWELPDAVRAEHLALASVAFFEGIVTYLKRGGGSRGSFVVLSQTEGAEMHPHLKDPATGAPLRFIPENESLRSEIIEAELADLDEAAFTFRTVHCRPIPERDEPFELAWAAFRSGETYRK